MNVLPAFPPFSGRHVVAIPVKNEADYILPCLQALAGQLGPFRFDVLLLLNDCTDATAAIVRSAAPALPFALHIHECELPPAHASAGLARRLAMQYASSLAGLRGILLTTDADSRVAPDWIATNVDAIAEGADAVAGCVELDPDDAAGLPPHLMQAEARVQHLADLLDEITWHLDADPADPRPRHVQHSGASIAVTAEMFHRAGGIPDVPVGEDRAFFRALQRVDARIRHCPQASVTVSGRIYGRAKNGMADTIRRRMGGPDMWLDDCLEPAADAVRRAQLRAAVRSAWESATDKVAVLAADLALAVSFVRQCLHAPTFGAAWQDLEDRSPRLQRRLIATADLEAEIGNAAGVLDALATAAPGPSARGTPRPQILAKAS